MSRNLLRYFSVVVLASSTSAFADWTYNPSTGHWYRLTNNFGTWAQANSEAVAAGGYLVTICSAEENTWVTQLATIVAGATERDGEGNNAWIGYRDAGSGWGWENGEMCGYTNLHSNWNSFAGNHAYIHGADHPSPGTWQHNPLHDNANDPANNVRGIIERDVDPAVPIVSEWGLVVMTLLTLSAGTIILVRSRPAAA